MTEAREPNGHAPAPRGILYRLLVSAPDGVFVTTEDNRIVLWNRAAETLMGYTAREAFGHPCRKILAGKGARGTPRCVTGCDVAPMLIIDGLDQTFEMQTRTKSGVPRWLNITAFAVTDAVRVVVHGMSFEVEPPSAESFRYVVSVVLTRV